MYHEFHGTFNYSFRIILPEIPNNIFLSNLLSQFLKVKPSHHLNFIKVPQFYLSNSKILKKNCTLSLIILGVDRPLIKISLSLSPSISTHMRAHTCMQMHTGSSPALCVRVSAEGSKMPLPPPVRPATVTYTALVGSTMICYIHRMLTQVQQHHIN